MPIISTIVDHGLGLLMGFCFGGKFKNKKEKGFKLKITLPFYYQERFLIGNKKDIWNQMRCSQDGIYSIPKDREMWVRRAQDEFPRKVGEDLATYLTKISIKKVFSVGVGAGGMEYHLKKSYPSCELTCSDFEAETIKNLKNVFTECDEFRVFDLLDTPLTHDFVVMSRVENEFNDDDLKKIFSMAQSKNILLIISDVLSLYRVFILAKDNFVAKIAGRRGPCAGYKRTWDQLESLFSNTYTIKDTTTIGGLNSVLLERIL